MPDPVKSQDNDADKREPRRRIEVKKSNFSLGANKQQHSGEKKGLFSVKNKPSMGVPKSQSPYKDETALALSAVDDPQEEMPNIENVSTEEIEEYKSGKREARSVSGSLKSTYEEGTKTPSPSLSVSVPDVRSKDDTKGAS